MSYDKLPPGLKTGSYFCLYKLEPGNDGKKKKVPYQLVEREQTRGIRHILQILQLHMKPIAMVGMTAWDYRLWKILLP